MPPKLMADPFLFDDTTQGVEIMPTWTRQEAINLCEALESFAPKYGAHIALTGGCLYRDGPRKDVDILVYRIRQVEQIDWIGFFTECRTIGIRLVEDFGWCKKVILNSKNIDFFDPDDDGEYGDIDLSDDFDPELAA